MVKKTNINDIKETKIMRDEELFSKEMVELSLSKLDMCGLIDDEQFSITTDMVMMEKFDAEAQGKKFYNEKAIKKFFRKIAETYNMELDTTKKYGALTHLKKVVNLLDYLSMGEIESLSLETLNILLDAESGNEILSTYRNILESRKQITNEHLRKFVEMLEDERVKLKKSEVNRYFNYISSLYNADTVLQDNVSIENYLRAFAKISLEKALKMRFSEIYDLFYITGPETTDTRHQACGVLATDN